MSKRSQVDRRRWRTDLVATVLAVGVLLAARSSLADHYHVPSGSMEPTVEVGDRVLVAKAAYGLRLPFSRVDQILMDRWYAQATLSARTQAILLCGTPHLDPGLIFDLSGRIRPLLLDYLTDQEAMMAYRSMQEMLQMIHDRYDERWPGDPDWFQYGVQDWIAGSDLNLQQLQLAIAYLDAATSMALAEMDADPAAVQRVHPLCRAAGGFITGGEDREERAGGHTLQICAACAEVPRRQVQDGRRRLRFEFAPSEPRADRPDRLDHRRAQQQNEDRWDQEHEGGQHHRRREAAGPRLDSSRLVPA